MQLRYGDIARARNLTRPEHRHRVRYSVGDDWTLLAIWCDLAPEPQEERP